MANRGRRRPGQEESRGDEWQITERRAMMRRKGEREGEE